MTYDTDLSILAPDHEVEPYAPANAIGMASGGQRGFAPWSPTPTKQALVDAIASALNSPSDLGSVLPVTARQGIVRRNYV